ncbi:E3 SUMO-protein ligase PIAS1-like [Melanaphis sacchari]|uniref:E3 SUMO-protein ligase PIAS1 n=1 Tax=Melanaphis sacchari TaxID=742174 RepID=A0A2H8TEB0_9HEMI|nr:E3 SUMO-protein ligase PIAS1-like [Melanaphis sacchari]
MNNYITDESCINMLNSFRTCDLRALLEAFDDTFIGGDRDELKSRAIELLKTDTTHFIPITHHKYKSKIFKMHESLPTTTYIKIECGYEPIQMDQAESTRVIPQIQRDKRKNSIDENAVPAKIMVDSNIQYTANRQQSVITAVSSQMPLNINEVSKNVNNDKLNNEKDKSFALFSTHLKFKSLPFYNNIYEVIKPRILSDSPKFANGEKIKFALSSDHVKLLNKISNIDTRKNKNTFKLQIRICELKKNFYMFSQCFSHEVSDCFPPGLEISFGTGSNIFLPIDSRSGTERRPSAEPIDCTKFVISTSSIEDTLNIKWTPNGNRYVLKMCVVQLLTAKDLLESILKNSRRSSEKTKVDIIKMFAKCNSDLITTYYCVSLVCPLSKLRMNIPAKSANCRHLKCFDAYTFLKMNENKPTWRCPICYKPCLFKDIIIFDYFLEILRNPRLNGSTDIMLLSNGTWYVYEDTSNTINSMGITYDSDIICLDD